MDIPIANGPAPALPDWAKTILASSHKTIALVYLQVGMPEASALHTAEANRIETMSDEAEGLADQLAQGWGPEPIQQLTCPMCSKFLILTFEGTCAACGAEHGPK